MSKASVPDATISPLGNLNICQTGSVVLEANGETGFTYQWLKGGTNIIGATQQTYTTTKTGSYKVVVFNNAGCSKTSSAVKVTKSCKEGSDDEAVNAEAISIFPNPSNGDFTVSLYLENQPDQPVTIQIFNTVGQIVHQQIATIQNGNLNEEIHLEDPAYGLYILKVITNEKQLSTHILIGQ